MPQLQLPLFPAGVTEITPHLAFKKEDGQIVYFNGHMPVAIHDEKDLRTFRVVTSQFYVMGLVSQSDLTRVFGVTPISVKRSVKKLREQGPGGFYAERRVRGAAVLLPDVVEKAEELLAEDMKISDVAKQLSISPDTLRKGIESGRVRVKKNGAPKGRSQLQAVPMSPSAHRRQSGHQLPPPRVTRPAKPSPCRQVSSRHHDRPRPPRANVMMDR